MALFPATHQACLNILRSPERTTAMVTTAFSCRFFLYPAFHPPFIEYKLAIGEFHPVLFVQAIRIMGKLLFSNMITTLKKSFKIIFYPGLNYNFARTPLFTKSIRSRPKRISTSLRENSMAVPGDLLVIICPSTTTLSS